MSALPDRHPRLLLAALCLLLWIPGFFTLPPTDRDEARFAQATRQMLETGDFVRIRFQAEERNKKPAGIHWAQAASVAAIGERDAIWAYRLPSLLGGLIAVLATFSLGRALVGPRAALLGGALLAASMTLVAEVHIAKTDAALLGAMTVAMGLLGRAYLAPAGFGPRAAAGFWLALGAAVLLKGPIGPVIPLLAGLTLAVVDRGAGRGLLHAPWLRALRPGWGIPLLLAATAPWFIAIGLATDGRFFADAVGGDMLAKVGGGEEKHWGPPGLYLALLPILGFPGVFLALLAIPAIWAARTAPPTRFLLAWIIPAWLMFEAVPTKLPHYVLPLLPPILLLGAAWALDPLRRMPPRWWAWLCVAGPIVIATGLAAAAVALPAVLLGTVWTPGLLALPAAAVFVWALLSATRTGAWARAGAVVALAAAPLYAAVLEGVAPRLDPIWIGPRLAATIAAAAPGTPPEAIGLAGIAEPSIVFALGTRLALQPSGAAAAAFLAAAPGRVAIVSDRMRAAFLDAAAARGVEPRPLGSLDGLNPSRGRWLTLTLYGASP